MQFIEMDNHVSLGEQMMTEVGPVVLVNILKVTPNEVEAMLEAWKGDAKIMKAQPGFISTQLHRGIANSSVFMNYAIWRSVEDFRAAFSNPEFQSKLEYYPASAVVSPHLFQKFAVDGFCVA